MSGIIGVSHSKSGIIGRSVYGITHASQWHITTSASAGTSGTLDSNWAELGGKIGTSMGTSVGSGWFTFPVTGIWKVTFHMIFFAVSGTPRYAEAQIWHSANGSGGDGAIKGYTNSSIGDVSAGSYQNGTASNIFNVVNTGSANEAVRCKWSAESSITLVGQSTYKKTGIEFIRLGDT